MFRKVNFVLPLHFLKIKAGGSPSFFLKCYQSKSLPVVIAALETLDRVIAGWRTVWTARIEITSALAQARYR